MSSLFAIVLSLLAIFLILLVLVQRGRGGGLAGALGGMGGSSAFGAKAGDVFTRITIITASIWIGICLIALFWAENRGDKFGATGTGAAASGPVGPGMSPPASDAVPGATDDSKSAIESGPTVPSPSTSTAPGEAGSTPATPPSTAPADGATEAAPPASTPPEATTGDESK